MKTGNSYLDNNTISAIQGGYSPKGYVRLPLECYEILVEGTLFWNQFPYNGIYQV